MATEGRMGSNKPSFGKCSRLILTKKGKIREIGTCAVVVHIDLSTYTFGIYNHMCECTFNSVLANSGIFFSPFSAGLSVTKVETLCRVSID